MKVFNGESALQVFRENDREERDGTVVDISRMLISEPPRMIEKVTVSGSRGQGRYERRQRLSRREDLRDAVQRAGCAVVAILADLSESPFNRAVSPSMWIVAERGGPDS